MAMEWILGIVVIVLGVAGVLVIYLSERINVFETPRAQPKSNHG